MKKTIQILRFLTQLLFFVCIVFRLVSGFMNIWSAMLVAVFFLTALAGNFYCGWICPFGTLQEWLGGLGSRIIKKRFRFPPVTSQFLKFSKYVIYIIIILNSVLGFAGTFADTSSFNGNFSFMNITGILSGPDALIDVNILAAVYLLIYLIAALFVERPFCNYFCPDSIQYNLTSFLRVISIKRDDKKCADCKRCDKACPMNINVSTCVKLRSANCINCMQCIGSGLFNGNCIVPFVVLYSVSLSLKAIIPSG